MKATDTILSARRLALLAAASVIAMGSVFALGGAAARGQESGGGDDEGVALEEIIVTARKREENMQVTPISISAFTGASLEEQQITNVSQIAEFTPNLIFDSGAPISGSSSAGSVYIRGIGQIDFTLTTEPGVGIYVDGVYLSQSIGSVLDLVDVERVEVLRGPQGTLFGRNTIGGAISVTSKKPSEVFSANVSATGGRYDRFDVKADTNIPLSDRFFVKFSGTAFNRDGFVAAPNQRGKLGDEDVKSGRVALRWLLSDTFEVNMAADYTAEREIGAPIVLVGEFTGLPVPPAPLPPSFAQLHNILTLPGMPLQGLPAFGPADVVDIKGDLRNTSDIALGTKTDVWGFNATLDWDLPWVSIKSISSFRNVTADTGRDQDGTPLVIGQQLDHFDVNQFSQELQFTGDLLDSRFNWILGLYQFSEDGVNRDDVEFTPVRIISGAEVDNRSSAVFGQFTFAVTPELKFTAGFRATDERKKLIIPDNLQFVLNSKFVSANTPFPPGPPVLPLSDALGNFVAPLFGLIGVGEPDPANPGQFGPTRVLPPSVNVKNISEFDPHVSLAYQWNEGLMTYVSYSEGFKSGGFTQRVFPPKTGVPSFDPEFAKVIEFGAKWTSPDNRVRINGDFFRTDYNNLQIQVNDGIAPVTKNAAAANIKGFELELQAAPAAGWLVTAGFGYLDANYSKLDPAVSLATDIRTITLATSLPNAPKWQINASANYTYVIGNGGQLIGRMDFSYRSLTFNDALNFAEIAQPGYTLINGGITYVEPDEHWDVALFVRNLTDKRYIVSGFANALTQGTADAIIGRPREWGLKLGFHF